MGELIHAEALFETRSVIVKIERKLKESRMENKFSVYWATDSENNVEYWFRDKLRNEAIGPINVDEFLENK